MLRRCLRIAVLALLCAIARPEPSIAAPVFWSANGHYYDFVTAPAINWFDARDAAAALTHLGKQGHLVTITSQAENDFINDNLNNGLELQPAWIGGFEPDDDGNWYWAVGPEAGIQFSFFATPTGPYNFANWGGEEPNNFPQDENLAGFNLGLPLGDIDSGQWGDAPYQFDPVVGYLVEFEAVPEPSSLLLLFLGSTALLARRTRRGKCRAGAVT